MKTIQLAITGMTCSACSTRIEKSIIRMEGVEQASVNLAMAQASIRLDPRKIQVKSIVGKIEQLGYKATDERSTPKARSDVERRSYRNRFLSAVLLSIPLLWAMLHHITSGSWVWTPSLFHEPFFQWGLATILQFYVGYPFYYGAYQALKQRTANMDVLVAMSTSVAYFYSHYAVLHPSSHAAHTMLYFDTIAMIMTAVLLGKWLESVARGRALKDVNALYDLQVRLIRVMRRQEEEWIAADQLQKGDLVIVHAGEWISADGYVLAGEAEVDESMLTGETRTILKSPRDRVYSGTRCANGRLRIHADASLGETRLARIIALVEQAQNEKPLLARKVDRLAAYFVPVMISCAFITFVAWLYVAPTAGFEPAMRHALAVLLVACPCALGLAAPVSILIATGQSAKSGILFKEGRALETLHQIDHVLLDKTGTLTEGKPQVISIQAFHHSTTYLLRMAAALEQHSSHPLAQAVVEAARKHRLLLPEAQDVREVPGGGMEAQIEGKTLLIGNESWLRTHGIPVPDQTDALGSTPNGEATVLYIGLDQQLVGILILADKLRNDAYEVVRELQQRGEVWMVTGDQRESALRTATEAGISIVHAGMQPEQKLELVRTLQGQGRKVALIGDGVNDAAALSAADIGIAMGGGTNAAIQAGDVVLVNDKLSGLVGALSISQRTMRNIKQNLLLAVLYNFVTIPLAAFGYMEPKAACIGMAASSVIVVSNALRLQRLVAGKIG